MNALLGLFATVALAAYLAPVFIGERPRYRCVFHSIYGADVCHLEDCMKAYVRSCRLTMAQTIGAYL